MTSWPLRDRSDSHHVASFNDINAILSIIGDGNYFDEYGYVTEDGLGVGQYFQSKDHLKCVVYHYHSNMNRTFHVCHSNKVVYTIKCTNQDCPWRLYASRRPSDDGFIINTRSGPHECVMESDRLEHPHLTSAFMASIIRESVKGNVRFTIKDIKVSIEQRYSFKAPYLKCWRAKEIAIAQLFRGWRQAYDLIHPLFTVIQRTNPGTKIEWLTRPSNNPTTCFFESVCWVYGPSIEAFKYLRPIIEIDGTHLSGRYGRKLLVATGYDAEDQLVPLAFALVEKERNKTWENFMRFVRREVVKTRRVTVLTDRHASILRIFNESNLGWSEQDRECYLRYCSRHLCQNFTKEFKYKVLTGYLRGAIRMNQKLKFKNKLGKIAFKCPAALQWIDDIGRDPLDTDKENPPRYDLWSLAFDQGGRRFGMMTTNGPESLNNIFKEARELSVTSLV